MIHTLIHQITRDTNLSPQEAWWILEHVCHKSQANLLATNAMTKSEIDQLEQILTQITRDKKPLAYIIGTVPFLNLTLHAQPPILIPRPETEEWVQRVIEKFTPFAESIKTILDVGTGSGCIALALASHFKNAQITAIDINPEALILAQKNATQNGIKNITLVESNLFENLHNQTFDLIVSNPPYIDKQKLHKLCDQVKNWEDHGALFADDHGLQIITALLEQSAKHLNIHSQLPAQLIIETDQDQKEIILQIAAQSGWHAWAEKDTFGQWRTIWAKK